jgi:ADP-dependent phosphofructokinase/glucokinase
MPLTPVQNTKLEQWYEFKSSLDFLRAEESKLRDELVAELFTTIKDAGSETIEIANGYRLKATKKLDYKLNNKDGQVEALIAIIDNELAKTLVHWTPELSITSYKNLDAQTQKLFNGCLTIKPGKASLEIVPPKAAQ